MEHKPLLKNLSKAQKKEKNRVSKMCSAPKQSSFRRKISMSSASSSFGMYGLTTQRNEEKVSGPNKVRNSG